MKKKHKFLPFCLILVVTFLLCFCILIAKSYLTSSKKQYDFLRQKSHLSFVTPISSIFDTFNIKPYTTLFSFDNTLFLKEQSVDDQALCRQFSLLGYKMSDVLLPKNCIELVSYTDSGLIWLSDFQLKYMSTKCEILPLVYRNKIINAIGIDTHKILMIETNSSNNHLISFALCTKMSNTLKLMAKYDVKMSDKYELYQEKALAYSGHFLHALNHITYSFFHIPYIYVFDNQGKFIKAIKTKDNVPFPAINRYKEYFLFDRGNCFNSNIASFVYKGMLCVFSFHAPINGKITLDYYSLSDGNYKGSIFVNNKYNIDNRAIDDIAIISNQIFINAKHKLMVYKISDTPLLL